MGFVNVHPKIANQMKIWATFGIGFVNVRPEIKYETIGINMGVPLAKDL